MLAKFKFWILFHGRAHVRVRRVFVHGIGPENSLVVRSRHGTSVEMCPSSVRTVSSLSLSMCGMSGRAPRPERARHSHVGACPAASWSVHVRLEFDLDHKDPQRLCERFVLLLTPALIAVLVDIASRSLSSPNQYLLRTCYQFLRRRLPPSVALLRPLRRTEPWTLQKGRSHLQHARMTHLWTFLRSRTSSGNATPKGTGCAYQMVHRVQARLRLHQTRRHPRPQTLPRQTR